jgi:hypothetical protein
MDNPTTKLPNGGQVREAAERSLELCAADEGYWSDTAFKERHVEAVSRL